MRQWKIDNPLSGLSGNLADMPADDGSSLRWEIDPLAMSLTLGMMEGISETPTYKLLATILPADKVALYFEKLLRDEIHPVIRALNIAQWHCGKSAVESKHEVVWDGHKGLGPLLQTLWPAATVPLKLGKTWKPNFNARPVAGRLYRKLRQMLRRRLRATSADGAPRPSEDSNINVAVHYVEGLNQTRRNDLFWHDATQAGPKRLVVYFDLDNVDIAAGAKSIGDSVVQQIENWGMNWVCLDDGLLERNGGLVWTTKPGDGYLLAEFEERKRGSADPMERWISKAAEWLVREVDYWVAFYRSYNVKIHVDVAAGKSKHIAQSIALDLTGGVRVGWQRSEFPMAEGNMLAHHPSHVFFVWNTRGVSGAKRNRNRIDATIISGFPWDGRWRYDAEPREIRAHLTANGADFVTAFFDNTPWWGGILSRPMMLGFYRSFLEWVLADPTVAVISKSKKPGVLKELPEIQGLMDQAEATNRWVNLTDSYGRLPSDASRAADMSVGISISSSVVEAVAAGGKGIHCDLPAMRSHPFYEWGYEKVVFDNLDRLMPALKRYKADPTSEPELGDFSNRMEQVDPFHDGRGGERIGHYISYLLGAFDSGHNRDNAIRQANEQYAQMWGADKVICLETAAR